MKINGLLKKIILGVFVLTSTGRVIAFADELFPLDPSAVKFSSKWNIAGTYGVKIKVGKAKFKILKSGDWSWLNGGVGAHFGANVEAENERDEVERNTRDEALKYLKGLKEASKAIPNSKILVNMTKLMEAQKTGDISSLETIFTLQFGSAATKSASLKNGSSSKESKYQFKK